MVDALSALGDVNTLIANLMAAERAKSPITKFQQQQSDLTLRSATLTDLRTNLTALNTQAQALAQVGSLSPLLTQGVTSSDTTVATGTADNTALAGTHSLLVTRLARQSTVVSKQLTQTGTNVASAEGAGTKRFNITVNGVTTPVDVAVGAGDTNKTVLTNMAAAINKASAGVTAAVVADSGTTARLVISSNETGTANAASLQDVTGSLLASTDTSSNAASSGAGGGYLYDPTTLDATFSLDGLAITRGSNTVDDVLPGVTLTLTGEQGVGAKPVTLTIGSDKSGVQGKVQAFLDSYNTLIKFLKERTSVSVDATTSAQGVTQVNSVKAGTLSEDLTYKNLLVNLRGDVARVSSTAAAGGPNSLATIGITSAADGTLSITDAKKFAAALDTPGAVATLFNGTDGVATRVSNRLEGFVKAKGIVENSLSTVTGQLSTINDAIKEQEKLLTLKQANLQSEFSGLLAVLAQLSTQQSMLSAVGISLG